MPTRAIFFRMEEITDISALYALPFRQIVRLLLSVARQQKQKNLLAGRFNLYYRTASIRL
jgi:hypothetical protein